MKSITCASGVGLLLAALSGGCRRAPPEPAVARLGYFANITHAPAIVALSQGWFAAAVGPTVRVEARVFNAGPEVVEAIFSGALDVAYIGPNPAINAFAQSRGEAIRIVAGATSGGASLVVRKSITTPAHLKGTRLATPQRGSTQDVALRAWLGRQGLAVSLEGGGDVSVVPQSNAQTLETFRAGQIDGAWAPEPWATRLVLEGGAHVLVDERTLWPDSQFVTTQVIVRTAFLQESPGIVKQILGAHLRSIEFLNSDPAGARAIVNAAIARVTGKNLPGPVMDRAWSNLRFTADPLPGTLRRSADDAVAVGLLKPVDLNGIYDLSILNALLTAAGKPQIRS